MIVDAHAHIEGLPGCPWQDPPELMVRLLDEASIDRAIVMTYVDAPGDFGGYDPIDYVARAIASFPDRLWGFARLDPGAGTAAQELLARCVSHLGFKGLKLHPFGYRQPPDSEQTVALVRVAADLGVPVLLHCGDEDYTRPLDLARLARACPEAKIIFGHMGGYFHVHDAISVAQEYGNVYLETSGTPYPAPIAAAVNAIGPERVLFASDGPGCDPRIELHKVERAGLKGSALSRVLGENIAEMLEFAGGTPAGGGGEGQPVGPDEEASAPSSPGTDAGEHREGRSSETADLTGTEPFVAALQSPGSPRGHCCRL